MTALQTLRGAESTTGKWVLKAFVELDWSSIGLRLDFDWTSIGLRLELFLSILM